MYVFPWITHRSESKEKIHMRVEDKIVWNKHNPQNLARKVSFLSEGRMQQYLYKSFKKNRKIVMSRCDIITLTILVCWPLGHGDTEDPGLRSVSQFIMLSMLSMVILSLISPTIASSSSQSSLLALTDYLFRRLLQDRREEIQQFNFRWRQAVCPSEIVFLKNI